MPIDFLQECSFIGPALPEPFVRFELEKELNREKLLSKATGTEAQALREFWDGYRRKLRELVGKSGAIRIRNQVIDPLLPRLGYDRLEAAEPVQTREGLEAGGHLLISADGSSKLRIWTTDLDIDLDAPAKRGAAYRFSHLRIAQRVLLACSERVGLLTNGVELRLLLSDPARPDSQVIIPIDANWKRSREVPDSLRLLLALASPAGVKAVPGLVDKARLQQARVTKDLRKQAREAVELFVQEVLDHPANREKLSEFADRARLAKELWREGLITIYRLLFILKLESSDDPARSFSFASTSLWRNSFSPSVALARYVRMALDEGAETGQLLERGLRSLFRMFAEGLQCTELNIRPLGGSLFGAHATPILSDLAWGERAVAYLLDRLLWTLKKGTVARERVHYGPLDVEDLGRVYEALLELEPGIADEPMCRLRRQKLEVVVPIDQGEKYRVTAAVKNDSEDEAEEEDAEESQEEETSGRGKKTKVEWIEAIAPGRFYLRVGLGRKASGSYYTPHSFVRFLVQETLGPQVAERSPQSDPKPLEILKLKVCDPAMGSGHFLVEACRFLGEKLYEACRLCDELAMAAEKRAESAEDEQQREAALEGAKLFQQRVADLPDPNDELLKYLPSRAPEGLEIGLSQRKAEAMCRRLIAVHCLYGVDKNPLAVELAKLSLWIESHAEGLPLTFLDHRLVLGDSLAGPFLKDLLRYPGSQKQMDDLLSIGLKEGFTKALSNALRHVHDLEESVGATLSEIEAKQAAKTRLDKALEPFMIVAAAWAGGGMLSGPECDDSAYARLAHAVASTSALPADINKEERLIRMIAKGMAMQENLTTIEEVFQQKHIEKLPLALPFDLTFVEVFFPHSNCDYRNGFDVLLGNPPWSKSNLELPEYMGAVDFRFLEVTSSDERIDLEESYKGSSAWNAWLLASLEEDRMGKIISLLNPDAQSDLVGFGSGHADIFASFVDRLFSLLRVNGLFAMVLPSSLHVSQSLRQLRRKLLNKAEILSYFSFENKYSLFEIHKSWKFTPVIIRNSEPKEKKRFPAQFYLHDDSWLFSANKDPYYYLYDPNIIEVMDSESLIFQEYTSVSDMKCAETIFGNSISWKKYSENTYWSIRRELNATDDRWRIEYSKPCGRTWSKEDEALIHHQPGTIHQYTDLWTGAKTLTIPFNNLYDRPRVLELSRYFRAAYRMSARATDERTSIFTILTPGTTATNSLPIEGCPQKRPNRLSLGAVAVCNSFVFDWYLRLRVGSKTISKFIMDNTPISDLASQNNLCVHSSLRLVSNHPGYETLWHEQVCDEWREPKPPFTWPVLESDDERWEVRSAIDAVVADAYGLEREQYAHILSSFSHRSYPKAPKLCLAKFDELQEIGLGAFTKKYDPYWDIPLNENLPQPVIDIPLLDPADSETTSNHKVLQIPGMDSYQGDRRSAPRAAESGKARRKNPRKTS
ncbi:Eco57I restriction-modification methylase domain-containing protein [Gloeobacter violaceus]|uniref:site-specific DNA-methyltransferase (adenine-specific) n=1 Tax=Gloeobacter violaceus (strain ATCC 29082 / PCC 7421) TaxID=251221 RepID=Q7NGZ7_GLOVI|nr:N-6 DNA methylase [Gloeobacter violaceus]BAC90681.1 gll2740 [Gloeobacter violaceus PCC 7421]